MNWILASASPRRKQLLKEIIPAFEIIPATGEEVVEGNLTPDKLVMELAKQKAMEVARLPQAKDCAVLGADTVVVLDNKVLGKPKDEADAVCMLTALSGRAHQVYTGVCIVYTDKGEQTVLQDCASTNVYFNTLTDEQITKYVQTGSPMDKAGAYGIQDGNLVARIDGSFSNVVGLPVELCQSMVEKLTKNG